MEKEFVPYELAVKLKELGFDEPCFGYYDVDEGYSIGYAFCYSDRELQPEIGCSAPLYQQAFRWILKNHKLHSFVDIYPTTDEPDRCWFMIRYLERGEDGKEDYMSGWFTNQDNINNSRLNKLLEIIESKSE